MLAQGFPAYTTSAGWIGYSDDKVRRLCQEAIDAGFQHIKMKVGRDLDADRRRARLIREIIGPDRKLMADANQVWDVPQAIAWMRELADFDLWWIEEPTSPDDILGHAAIARAWRRLASLPVNTCTIGSSSNSCCRQTLSVSVRSTPAASVA
jgi:L-fuconate dehydratase